MRKFFINQNIIQEDMVFITGLDYNHIKNVLRLKIGNNIIVNNKSDFEYEVQILGFQDERVSAKIIRQIEMQSEPSVNLTLFQGIPKGDKMELIIQKAVEIGVKKIVPIITDRVVVKLDEKSAKKKTERWQKISEEAAKQSRRNAIPEVTLPAKFKDVIQLLDCYDLKIILYENEKKQSIRDIFDKTTNKPKNIAVFIGPEGGLSDEEISMSKDIYPRTTAAKPPISFKQEKAALHPWITDSKIEMEKSTPSQSKNPVYIASLGPRILRTETAGLVAAAIILYQMGDMD
jgi:16S rRNA (uracil1498-N3)-methyltransferase